MPVHKQIVIVSARFPRLVQADRAALRIIVGSGFQVIDEIAVKRRIAIKRNRRSRRPARSDKPHMNRPAAGAAVSVMNREILRRPHNAVGIIVRETRVPIEHQRPVPAPHVNRTTVMTRMVIIEQRRPVEIHRRRRIRINRQRTAIIGTPVRIERDIIQKIHRPRTDPDRPRLVGPGRDFP